MNFGLRNIWPFRGMGPVDLRVEVNCSELAVVKERAGIKRRAEVPFDSVSRDLAHRVHRTTDKSRVDRSRIDESWFGNMLNVCSRRNRSLGSRDTRGSVKDLLKVSHPAFKRRKRKFGTAELIEGTAEFAAGATPQANSDVAKSL